MAAAFATGAAILALGIPASAGAVPEKTQLSIDPSASSVTLSPGGQSDTVVMTVTNEGGKTGSLRVLVVVTQGTELSWTNTTTCEAAVLKGHKSCTITEYASDVRNPPASTGTPGSVEIQVFDTSRPSVPPATAVISAEVV